MPLNTRLKLPSWTACRRAKPMAYAGHPLDFVSIVVPSSWTLPFWRALMQPSMQGLSRDRHRFKRVSFRCLDSGRKRSRINVFQEPDDQSVKFFLRKCERGAVSAGRREARRHDRHPFPKKKGIGWCCLEGMACALVECDLRTSILSLMFPRDLPA